MLQLSSAQAQADIAGSGFAITGYTVHEALGGDAAMVRQQLRQRGLRLMLDFVPALPVQPV